LNEGWPTWKTALKMARSQALLRTALIALLCPFSFAAESDLLGKINFPTSANGAAQEHFLAGVAYLHSFGFKQARSEFLRVQELDPGFALGYWGESLTYNHPLHAESDLLAPARSLEKLARTRQERDASAGSGIERGFLAAAEAFAFTQGTIHERRRAYRSAMEELYGNHPANEEVRAFYTLALISEAASASGEQRAQLRELAGLLATRLFEQNPGHPGAIHYVIHSYDDAANAELALNAADRYAETAPLVSHARHMPSHIYGHLGRWYEVAEVNETAFYTARALWRPGDDPHDQIHALDFGLYGDLQLADFEAAERWIERAEDTLAQNPDHQPTRELLARMHARLMVESKHWAYQPINNTRTDDELFAYGLSAVNMRDLALARQANTLLKERTGREPADFTRKIAQLELEASILFASGQTDASWTAIDKAIELALEHPNIDPLAEPIKPPLELKGELLLRDGKIEQAIEAFREALEVTAQRPWSLLGLARSYAAAGLNESASNYYQQLLNHWTDSRLLGVSEARTHLSIYGQNN
jgi:tetratricopeptide (TPR) repeat protein